MKKLRGIWKSRNLTI